MIGLWAAWRRKGTRWPSGLAIAALIAATALPVVLLAVGGGVATHEIQTLESSGFQISVSAAGNHGIAPAHQLTSKILTIHDVAAASPVLSQGVEVFPDGGGAHPALAEGILPAMFTATENPQERGLFPRPLPLGDPSDAIHYANGSYSGPSSGAVMLSTPFLRNLGLKVGDQLIVSGDANLSDGLTFQITGTFGVPPEFLGPNAADALLLPLSDLQVLTGFARGPSGLLDQADVIEVGLVGSASTSSATVASVAASVQQLVPFYGVSMLSDQIRATQEATSILTGFYLALSSVGLAVGTVFLMLVMIRRVEVDRRSLGIRRALGLPGRSIFAQLSLEASTLAASGALGGILAGYVVVGVLARWGQGAVAIAAGLAIFPPLTMLWVFALVVALGLAAGLVSVRRALRLPLPEVLR